MQTKKEAPKKVGPKFLRESFSLERKLLEVQLELSQRSVTHAGVQGEVSESRFIDVLRRYLPRRYSIDTGIVIDCEGKTSHQIDVVVYDNQFTPTLLDQKNHRFVPAEAVYAVFEVKPNISKAYLEYAADKAASVRKLRRTSIPIVHAGGVYPAKPVFDIVAGIVAKDTSWASGLESMAFRKAVAQLSGDRHLDAGLAITGGCFDFYDMTLHVGAASNSLTYFLFRLLQKLQTLGTVPAVDWSAYGRVLSKAR